MILRIWSLQFRRRGNLAISGAPMSRPLSFRVNMFVSRRICTITKWGSGGGAPQAPSSRTHQEDSRGPPGRHCARCYF